MAGKECVLCECNGNVDPWDPGHCDTSSGVCLKCHSHTSGDDCERCEDGYYGDAITAKNCQGNRTVMMMMFIVLIDDSSTDPITVTNLLQETSFT